VAISWAYELTPEGLKKSHEVSLDESVTRASGRALDFFIIGVLAVALGYFVWDKFAAGPATPPAVTQQVVEADETPQARHAASHSSSRPRTARTCGRKAMTGGWTTSLPSRARLPRPLSGRCN
jgi:hypothetical protein